MMVGPSEGVMVPGSDRDPDFNWTSGESLTTSLQLAGLTTERPCLCLPSGTADNVRAFHEENLEARGESIDGRDTQTMNDVCRLRLRSTIQTIFQPPKKDDVITWSGDPARFFGLSQLRSNERWTWDFVWKKAISSVRLPFLKANLSEYLDSRLEHQGTSDEDHRWTLLLKTNPSFEKCSGKEQRSQRRKFQRYLDEGKTLQVLATISPGLLITVAPSLTREDFQLIKRFLRPTNTRFLDYSWLKPDILACSVKYNQLSIGLLQFMVQDPEDAPSKNRQKQLKFAGAVSYTQDGLSKMPHKHQGTDQIRTHHELLVDMQQQLQSTEDSLPLKGVASLLESEMRGPQTSDQAAILFTTQRAATTFTQNQIGFQSNPNRVQIPILDYPLSTPKSLLVPQNLFRYVWEYFEKCCQNLCLDSHGALLSSNGAELPNELCNDFDSYCFTASMFHQKNSPAEFGCALSKACGLIEEILRAEHPRTLACFLEVLIHLIQAKLPAVAVYLVGFIRRMSARVITQGHPWAQICRLLAELDPEFLDQALAQIWKCTVDVFERMLGKSGRLVISVRLDYIKRVYGVTNHYEEERLLRDVLSHFDCIPRSAAPRVMLNLAHNLNKQTRYTEADEMAQNVLHMLQNHELFARRGFERIECKKIISWSQLGQGKALLAEQSMREAIGMVIQQRGTQHPWALEFMNVLESWLRCWGREDDANSLLGNIGELIHTAESCMYGNVVGNA